MPTFTSKLRRRQLDKQLSKYKDLTVPGRGFIFEIRKALEMSTYQLATRMGLSQSTIKNFEENECSGTISLNSLEKVATALGCKLVYALVPDETLEDTIYQQAKLRARKISKGIFKTMALEKQSTSNEEHETLIEEIAEELVRSNKRELWKNDQ